MFETRLQQIKMAAAHVQRTSRFCYHILSNCQASKRILSARTLSTVTKVEIEDSQGKVKKSLYDVYLEKKAEREPLRPRPITEEGPVINDLATRMEEERKKIVKKDLDIKLEKREYTEKSVRAGAVGVKIGMSTLWRKDGKRVLVSLIQVVRQWKFREMLA